MNGAGFCLRWLNHLNIKRLSFCEVDGVEGQMLKALIIWHDSVVNMSNAVEKNMHSNVHSTL